MFSSWFSPASSSSSPLNNSRTLFFAGFIHPELQQRLAARFDKSRQQHQRPSSSSATSEKDVQEDSAVEDLVRDFFEVYGSVDLFHFEPTLGVGVVRYQSGKSGENAYLMSHLLPFRMEKQSHKTSSCSDRRRKKPFSKETVEGETSPPFSLVCIEFARLLPFGDNIATLSSSALPWVCNRKSLHELDDYYQHHNNSNYAESSSTEASVPSRPPKDEEEMAWKNHLAFMSRQRRQRHAFAQSVSQLRGALVLPPQQKQTDGSGGERRQQQVRINGEVASLLQAEIEAHLLSLLNPSSPSPSTQQEQHRYDDRSDFWSNCLVPHCLDKIFGQLCEIDFEEACIVAVVGGRSGGFASPQQQKQQQQHTSIVECTIRPVVHSSISILDVWFAIYSRFYSGDIARTQHLSTVALLEHRLLGSSGGGVGLRHPAWTAFNLKFPTEEAKRRSGASVAISRRSDLGKLFQVLSGDHVAAAAAATDDDATQQASSKAISASSPSSSSSTAAAAASSLHPIHLGLKEWPGGASDDAGSSLRAIAAMLCAIRPLYQDTPVRHMWCSLLVAAKQSTSSAAAAAAAGRGAGTGACAGGDKTEEDFLLRLRNVEPNLKKAFFTVCSGDAALDGAWALLFRGQWRMETAFSLVASYLKEAPSAVEAAAEAGTRPQRKQKKKVGSDSAADDANKNSRSSSGSGNLIATLQLVDTQPPLWPLIRPIDPIEVDWKRTGGVFCDAAGVYERMFDNSKTASATSSAEGKDARTTLIGMVWSALCDSVAQSCLLTFGFVLTLFGQNPALASSRHYRRQVWRALGSLLVPVLWTSALGAAIFYALRSGYVARAQVVLYNLLTTLSLEGDGQWTPWSTSGKKKR